MKTCKTCKWWKRSEPSPHDGKWDEELNEHIPWYDAARSFLKAHGYSWVGSCSHPKVNNHTSDCILPSADALGADAYEGYPSVTVGQDFGCIHHEEKP